MIDYRHLLAKYMEHVGEQEGTCFIGRSLDQNLDFTDEERDALRGIEYNTPPETATVLKSDLRWLLDEYHQPKEVLDRCRAALGES